MTKRHLLLITVAVLLLTCSVTAQRTQKSKAEQAKSVRIDLSREGEGRESQSFWP